MMRDDLSDTVEDLNTSFPSIALSPTAKAATGGNLSPGEEDVRIGGCSSLPEIQFSDRVHEAIDAKLANSVIMRLLGRSIGYQTLLNRIHLLWKPKGAMSLIDLDNNYFLVCFAVEEDFRNKEEYPSQIMVWVRLPKLPYPYYTKSLFRYITAAIGKVVRIDYNTPKGKRGRFARLAIIVDLKKPLVSGIIIDGQRQYIEYKGLPEICFKCGLNGHSSDFCGVAPEKVADDIEASICRDPNALYGPWMQVIDRRRKVGMQKKVMGRASTTNSGKMLYGSRFEVLMDEVDHIDDGRNQASTSNKLLTENNLDSESLLHNQRDRRVPTSKEPQQRSEVSALMQSVEVLSSSERVWDSGTMRGETDLVRGQADPGRVASVGRVVTTKSTLNAAKNVAVQVLELGMGLGSHASQGRILPSSLKSGPSKSNFKPSKINQSLASGLSKLVDDLNNAEASVASKLGSTSSDVQGVDKRVHGIPNSTFEQHGSTEMQVPNIVVVMEPRISGKAADSFIRKAGFDSSYRVEARGFSDGIWVLWNDSVTLDILAVSNQYIHGFCSLVGENRSFFLTCVYASPKPLKHRILWNHLKALEPASCMLWVIGGDLNFIASSFERQGGSHYRSNICRDFGDFMMDTGLLDMGFNGPNFTWKRGTLSQRLDKCICNSAWYGSFPSFEVFHLSKLGSDHHPILLDTGSSATSFGNRPFCYIIAWNDHPGFNDFLKDAWSETGDVAINVASFRDKVRKWNLEVFGHIGRRKNMFLARIKGVEEALELSSNPFLKYLEVELKRELNLVLEQEESLWFQRARSQWVEKKDRNTTFFSYGSHDST
ncbi:hypothetical protein GQ457_08G017640 [Hibiscus cannabinus]